MLYNLYEMNHAALVPWRAAADMGLNFWQNPVNPWSSTSTVRASLELFERATRRFAKPSFGLKETTVGGVTVGLSEQILLHKPFVSLLHFSKVWPEKIKTKSQPKL